MVCEIKSVCRMLYLGSGWIEIEFSTDKMVPLFKNVEYNLIESSQLLKTEWTFNRVNSQQLKFMIILVNHTWEFYKTKIQEKQKLQIIFKIICLELTNDWFKRHCLQHIISLLIYRLDLRFVQHIKNYRNVNASVDYLHCNLINNGLKSPIIQK